ncbi:threonylcarbamoyl-AMP synthase [Streptococcus sp. HMSC073D05]|uniref:L-threonylcarbamoyladenylate synthase n=1 Tax=Streptococcus parasanguinis TaxID=1318 RepID=A0A6I3P4V8_STRPA|nr:MULTISPECIES: L-threonylcarbamoyladenylate synthase [Streptococcus]MDC0807635.1 L-threonylcarbamoyladenylate synthase [Collinsella aerofaciens]MTR41217.1 threonylcarbamoyl-AMP synthase [Streptococcus parasanguinis]OFK12620.1 threonylcarbamoyl-AMP synthase [Streptococcus sp. HMSC073D05]
MDHIEKELEAGRAVILPTETVYGIFAKALDQQAVDYIYELKRRPREKALNLNVADEKTIRIYSKSQPSYLSKLIASFLPGPLTIILQANEKVPEWIHSGMDTVGFRIPAHPKTLELIRKFGPLVGPSANLSGYASGTKYEAIVKEFDQLVPGFEDDAFLTGQDSTILDISGSKARILRQGTITKSDLLEQVPELSFEEEDLPLS